MSNQHLIKTYSDRRYLFTTMVVTTGRWWRWRWMTVVASTTAC